MSNDVATENSDYNINYLPAYMVNPSTGTVDEKYQDEAAQVSQGVATALNGLSPSEKAIFLATLSTDTMAPDPDDGDPWSPDQINKTIANLTALSKRMSDVFTTGGGPEQLYRLLMEHYLQQHIDSLAARALSREIGLRLNFKQADKLRDAAEKTLEGAAWKMAITIAVGVISVAVSVYSIGKSTKSMLQTKDAMQDQVKADSAAALAKTAAPNSLAKKTAEAQADSFGKTAAKARDLASRNAMDSEALKNSAHPISMLGGGVSEYVYQLYNYDSEMLRALAQELQAMAAYYDSMSREDSEFQSGFKTQIDLILKAIQELEAAREESLRIVTSNNSKA
jgi:hypothetical protein